MPADVPCRLLGADLLVLQRTMLRAVHGDAAAFRATASAIQDEGVAGGWNAEGGIADGGNADGRIAADKRLFLHLNTIDHALVAVLRQAYPATARLLGAERFEALAKAFIRAEPPVRPVLSAYGAGFERFLAGRRAPAGPSAEPSAALLSAVARLDWAAQQAYFAADATPLAAAGLAAIPPEQQAALFFSLVPSARLVPLAAPAAWRRWAELTDRGSVALVEAAPEPEPAAALVWRRPDLAVAARPLSAGELTCLAALAAGRTLLEAAEAAAAAGTFDLARLLTAALAGGLFRAPAARAC